MRLRNGKIVDTAIPYLSKNRQTNDAAIRNIIRCPEGIVCDLFDSDIDEKVKDKALALWWFRSKDQIILEMRADGLLVDTKDRKIKLVLQWIQSDCSSKSNMFNFVSQNKRTLRMAENYMMLVSVSVYHKKQSTMMR